MSGPTPPRNRRFGGKFGHIAWVCPAGFMAQKKAVQAPASIYFGRTNKLR